MKTARSLSVVPEREAIAAAQSLSRPIIRRPSSFVPTEGHKRMYELLGVNWVCHPEYVPKARHSFNPDIYGPARQDFLNRIAYCARVDRERNPAFRRAEAIRAAI
jgi:hypothetical protein